MIHTHRIGVLEAFRQRGLAYTTTFVDSVEAWIATDRLEMLTTGTRLLTVAGVPYVRVVGNGEILASEGWEQHTGGELLPLEDTPHEPTTAFHSSEGGALVLDIVIPFRGLWNTEIRGHVRLGLDATAPMAAIGSMIALVSGLSATFLVILWGAGMLIALRSARDEHTTAGHAAAIAADDRLSIDEDRKAVVVDGATLRFPPKQYALLRLLASERGRVFSDREILDAVWPDSPFADAKDVKQCVYLVRRRLASAGEGASSIIDNVAGFGYRIRSTAGDDPNVT